MEVKMSQHKEFTPRACEMYSLIEKYFTTNLTQRTFCEQQGIAYSTFHWWLHRYKTDNAASLSSDDKRSGDFIPVHIAADTAKVLSSTCHIEYPNGVIVHLLHADVRLISELIGLQTD